MGAGGRFNSRPRIAERGTVYLVRPAIDRYNYSVPSKNITNIFFLALLKTVLLVIVTLTLIPTPAAQAQASSAAELISAVNAYRASYGLAPYDIDGALMGLAQDQAVYQASVQSCTHTRSDGSQPSDHGISAENVACGLNLSAQGAIAQWSDTVHTATMLGPDTGLVGAGVSASGNSVYYTLDVKRLTGEFVYRPPQNNYDTSGSQQEATPQAPVGAVVTVTPGSDGSIVHIIKYGETLVEIANAYGISLNQLISLNKLDPKKPVYYANQALIIRLAFTATPYMTATFTPAPPTRTPAPSRTPHPTKTATPFHTPVPTRTDTAEPLVKLPTIEELGPVRPIMAYAFIAISAIGLVVLLFTAFIPGKNK